MSDCDSGSGVGSEAVTPMGNSVGRWWASMISAQAGFIALACILSALGFGVFLPGKAWVVPALCAVFFFARAMWLSDRETAAAKAEEQRAEEKAEADEEQRKRDEEEAGKRKWFISVFGTTPDSSIAQEKVIAVIGDIRAEAVRAIGRKFAADAGENKMEKEAATVALEDAVANQADAVEIAQHYKFVV